MNGCHSTCIGSRLLGLLVAVVIGVTAAALGLLFASHPIPMTQPTASASHETSPAPSLH